MKKLVGILTMVLGLCCSAFPALAETAYITDIFQVTFRTGPTLQNKIIEMLSSGQSVEVLETRDEWSRVRRLEGSQEGWVLTRYLMTRRPWKSEAEVLARENERLKERLAALQKKYTDVAEREGELGNTLGEKTAALDQLEREFETLKRESSDFLALKSAHLETKSRLADIQAKFEVLVDEHQKVVYAERYKWIGVGAGILLIGLVIGLVFGKRERKPRSRYL